MAAAGKIVCLFSAQQHQLEDLTVEPAGAEPGLEPCQSDCWPGAQIPEARPTEASGSLPAPPFPPGGALGPHSSAALPVVLNLSIGPSQQQTVPLSGTCSEKPKSTTSWSWEGAILPVELGPGGRNRIAIYTRSSLFEVLYKTQKAKSSVSGANRPDRRQQRIMSCLPFYTVTPFLPERFPLRPLLFLSSPSSEQSYY